ncbi:MAG: hypothetical protein JWQ50_6793 [Caballeronia mineralivorans]|jgi:hypothetical protein|nr:hypothetical protein [Caballeronia mineralivorans]
MVEDNGARGKAERASNAVICCCVPGSKISMKTAAYD